MRNEITGVSIECDNLRKENINMKYECGELVQLSQYLFMELQFLNTKTCYKKSIMKELMKDIMYYVNNKARQYKYKHHFD